MLVLAPAACCLAGVAVHDALTALFHGVHGRKEVPVAKKDEAVRPKKATKGAAKVHTWPQSVLGSEASNCSET